MAISCKSIGTGCVMTNSTSSPIGTTNKDIAFKSNSICTVLENDYSDSFSISTELNQPLSATDDVDIILSRLSPEELETAACASYDYLLNPDPSTQIVHARQIAQRYLNSKKNVAIALKKLKSTLEFRRSIDVAGLIKAFDKESSSNNDYALRLEEQLFSKKMYVQGYDKVGRSTLFFIPRRVQGHDPEWTLKEAVYSIERAIACSDSEDGLINAVVDFSSFSIVKHSPPIDIGKQFLTTLRNHYAGHIHRIYLVDTPATFSFFWKIFKPFIGKNTRDKIHFLSGKKEKSKLQELYDLNQAPSWMIPGGVKNRGLDLDCYLHKTVFHHSFDEQ